VSPAPVGNLWPVDHKAANLHGVGNCSRKFSSKSTASITNWTTRSNGWRSFHKKSINFARRSINWLRPGRRTDPLPTIVTERLRAQTVLDSRHFLSASTADPGQPCSLSPSNSSGSESCQPTDERNQHNDRDDDRLDDEPPANDTFMGKPAPFHAVHRRSKSTSEVSGTIDIQTPSPRGCSRSNSSTRLNARALSAAASWAIRSLACSLKLRHAAIERRDQLQESTDNTAGSHRHRFVGRFATVRDAFQISPHLVHRQ
jgi:hypothetical protein